MFHSRERILPRNHTASEFTIFSMKTYYMHCCKLFDKLVFQIFFSIITHFYENVAVTACNKIFYLQFYLKSVESGKVRLKC